MSTLDDLFCFIPSDSMNPIQVWEETMTAGSEQCDQLIKEEIDLRAKRALAKSPRVRLNIEHQLDVIADELNSLEGWMDALGDRWFG